MLAKLMVSIVHCKVQKRQRILTQKYFMEHVLYRIIILSACNCTYNDGKSEINKLSQVYVISMDLFL